MVILKVGTGTGSERELEIVNEKGDWHNGSYHLFESSFIGKEARSFPEPHDITSSRFLGEVIVDKDKAYWEYKGDKLNGDEQKEVAKFIIDYQAPDGVY
jgi:hypothetical protein